jgi:hypothetical protein
MMPEDRLEPNEVAKMLCPQCGLVQDFASCKYGEPLCEVCDPDPEMHVRCMPPERAAPYLLLLDCRAGYLRILKATSKGLMSDCTKIATHYNEMLEGRGIK